MGIGKIHLSALLLVFLILVPSVCLPVSAASIAQNIAVTKLVDESNYKKTLYVITTSDNTYHVIVQANITVVGNETLMDLNATLYNPANETITASARTPDTITLPNAPYYNGGYYNGPVQAWVLSLNSTQVFKLDAQLVVVMVAAIIFQVIAIAALLIIAPVLYALKTLFFGGPFIYASIPWVLLTLLQDKNQTDGTVKLYFPEAPLSLVDSWISHEEYFVASDFHWWKISEHEITFLWITLLSWYEADVYSTIGSPSIPGPTAEFIWNPNEPFVNETVFFNSTSYAQQGATITTYRWGLGDSKTENVPSFNYVYNNPGVFNVTLKVTDSNGNSSSVSHNVTVQAVALTATLRVVPLDLEVSVQAGQSAGAPILVEETLNQTDLTNVTFTAFDLTDDYDNWTISSGNITFDRNAITVTKGTYTNVTATFNAPLGSPIGWYLGNITATSDNGGNETIFTDLFVYGPPTANFTWSPLTPNVGEVVTFDASSTIPGGGAIADYEWNFGDGQTASGLTVAHTYASAATYAVTLNVTDENNLWNTTQEQVHVIRHDVAIEDVVPDSNWVYQGSLNHAGVNVTVGNLGEVPENFTVTLYASNDTATPANLTVGTQQVMDLPPDGILVLRFVWNSSDAQPCHWYNMTAVASTVQGETNTENNVNSSLVLVKVRLVGDVNGDGRVDLTDVGLAASAFLTTPGDQRWLPWGPYADIDNNGIIDLFDIGLIAENFGKTCI